MRYEFPRSWPGGPSGFMIQLHVATKNFCAFLLAHFAQEVIHNSELWIFFCGYTNHIHLLLIFLRSSSVTELIMCWRTSWDHNVIQKKLSPDQTPLPSVTRDAGLVDTPPRRDGMMGWWKELDSDKRIKKEQKKRDLPILHSGLPRTRSFFKVPRGKCM